MSKLVYQTSQTTHWKNLFPSKTMLLGSHNLNVGEELVAVISRVDISSIKDQNGNEEKVPVCQFENAPPMVLNITNTRTIAGLYGDSYEGWVGKPIQIFATKVKAFGKEEMALRVREKVPAVDVDTKAYEKKINAAKSMDELKKVFMAIPPHIRSELTEAKDKKKAELS